MAPSSALPAPTRGGVPSSSSSSRARRRDGQTLLRAAASPLTPRRCRPAPGTVTSAVGPRTRASQDTGSPSEPSTSGRNEPNRRPPALFTHAPLAASALAALAVLLVGGPALAAADDGRTVAVDRAWLESLVLRDTASRLHGLSDAELAELAARTVQPGKGAVAAAPPVAAARPAPPSPPPPPPPPTPVDEEEDEEASVQEEDDGTAALLRAAGGAVPLPRGRADGEPSPSPSFSLPPGAAYVAGGLGVAGLGGLAVSKAVGAVRGLVGGGGKQGEEAGAQAAGRAPPDEQTPAAPPATTPPPPPAIGAAPVARPPGGGGVLWTRAEQPAGSGEAPPPPDDVLWRRREAGQRASGTGPAAASPPPPRWRRAPAATLLDNVDNDE